MAMDEQEEMTGEEKETMEQGLATDARALQEGEIITARVVHVQDELAFVDVGWKSDLPIILEELSLTPITSAKEAVKEGESVRVMVIKIDDDEGITLSKKRADQEYRWVELEEALAKGEPVSGRVTDRNKGGLVVDIGVRGFVPASQAALSSIEDLSTCIGETWQMRVMEVDRAAGRVVLSRRAILEEEREKARLEAYSKLHEGDIVEGKVTRLTNFGAFVDLGAGVEGLLHVSEIAWERVNNPADRLTVGEILKIQIIKIDPEAGRISLTLKQLHPHPWIGVAERFPEGTVTTGKVVRIQPFGAFVRLADGIDGLVHISQLADRRVNKPEEVVSLGQEVKVKVLKVDQEAKRISLSMQEAAEGAEREQVRAFLKDQAQEEMKLTIGDLIRIKQEQRKK